ncbi:hypothetical protein [Nocardioides dilutus]
MTRGPQQQRLRDYLASANQDELRRAARQWHEGQLLLQSISEQLDRMSGEMATSDDEEFQGRTADAARLSFVTSSKAMADKATQLRQGTGAFEQSAAALDTAIAERDALAQGDGAQPPVRPSTPPGSTDPADVRAQRDFDTANAAYWEKYHADERRAADAITALDQSHTAAGEVFKSIHGEPDPVAPSGGGGVDSGGGGGGVSPPVGGGGGGRDTDFDPTDGTDQPDDHTDNTDNTDDDPDTTPDGTTVPPGTGGPVFGEPTGPTGPSGPVGTTTPGVGAGPVPTAGPAGPSTPIAGGVAAGLGVGLAGGLAGGVAGGLAFPGTVVGTGGAASGGRGIGAGGPRGAGSPVLGRGSGIAGVGNGAGTARGNARGSGRAATGGATGRGAGRSGARGAAGSRGTLAGVGAAGGGRSDRRGDKRRPGEDHELFDDGQDWLDDEDVYDGVID